MLLVLPAAFLARETIEVFVYHPIAYRLSHIPFVAATIASDIREDRTIGNHMTFLCNCFCAPAPAAHE